MTAHRLCVALSLLLVVHGVAAGTAGFPSFSSLKKLLPWESNRAEATDRAQPGEKAKSPAPLLKVGSWNIKHLSKKHTGPELDRIAGVLKRFDICAVQEVHDDEVCKKLMVKLPGWGYRLSEKVGRGARNKDKARVYEERYAFFFNKATIAVLKEPVVVHDGADVLVREPFVGYFKGVDKSQGGLDFIMATVHVTFGEKGLQARRDEMASLGRMLSAIEAKCAPEKNIFLVGDFNLAPEEAPWRGQKIHGGFVPLIDHPDTTTIYGSLYDNFWVPENTHAKESGVMYIDHEFFPDSKEPYKSPKAKAARKICNKVLSDHRPIFATFENKDDDDETDAAELSKIALKF